jgi:hypothetical protein
MHENKRAIIIIADDKNIPSIAPVTPIIATNGIQPTSVIMTDGMMHKKSLFGNSLALKKLARTAEMQVGTANSPARGTR